MNINDEMIKIEKAGFEPASIEVITFDEIDIICTSPAEGEVEPFKIIDPLDLGLYD